VKKIQTLGTGCPKCQALAANAEAAGKVPCAIGFLDCVESVLKQTAREQAALAR